MLIDLPNECYRERVINLLVATAALRSPIRRVAVRAVNLAHRLGPPDCIVERPAPFGPSFRS